jgi:Ariadne domain
MTCQKCRHEFCWICMRDWANHGANTGGYYKCNRFENGDLDADGDESDAARAKRDLDRYLHYYKRYHAHHQAQGFAQKQLKETEQRMVQLQESSVAAKWTDVEFLKVANEQLVECRRVLKYTYIFGFYFDGGATPAASANKDTSAGTSSSSSPSPSSTGRGIFRSSAASSGTAAASTSTAGAAGPDAAQPVRDSSRTKLARERFEYHQEMLERFTESLSELSEKPLDQMNREGIVNQTRVVDKFMKNILQYVDDGMEDDHAFEIVGNANAPVVDTNPNVQAAGSSKTAAVQPAPAPAPPTTRSRSRWSGGGH